MKKGSGTYYWSGCIFFWALDRAPTTRHYDSAVMFKALSMSSLTLLDSSLQRRYISLSFRHEATVASKF